MSLIFRAIYGYPENLLQIISNLKNIAPVINLHITRNGIYICEISKDNAVCINIFIDRDDFINYIYDSKENVIFGISTNNFYNILKSISSNETIILGLTKSRKYKKGSKIITMPQKLIIETYNGLWETSMSLKYIKHPVEEKGPDDIDYDLEIEMDLDNLKLIIEKMSVSNAKNITFDINNNGLFLNTKTEYSNIKIKLEPRNNIKFYTTNKYFKILFNLSKIKEIVNSNYYEKVVLSISENYPLKIGFSINIDSNIDYHLVYSNN